MLYQTRSASWLGFYTSSYLVLTLLEALFLSAKAAESFLAASVLVDKHPVFSSEESTETKKFPKNYPAGFTSYWHVKRNECWPQLRPKATNKSL